MLSKPEYVEHGFLSNAEQIASVHSSKRELNDISLLVIHCISLPEGIYSLDYASKILQGSLSLEDIAIINKIKSSTDLNDYSELHKLEISAHLFINRQGEIKQFVNFADKAWHAGKSVFAGKEACNDYSIGIELEGTDHTPYTKEQYNALIVASKAIMQAYPSITLDRITGHENIALPKGRKTDPGKFFDWKYYKNALL